jgi:hypothetical protein
VLSGVLLAVGVADGATPAAAQGRLDARYQVSLAGVPFATGSWHINVSDNQFTAAVSGSTTGMLRLLSVGRGTSASRGAVSGGLLIPSAYSSSISTDRKYDEVRMLLGGGSVRDVVADPPTPPDPERVPLTDAHRRGVQDPMTASIMRVPGNGDTFVPQACNRRLAIFDGRMRYDVQLTFKRLDRVRSERGYQGTVVVCGAHFSPIAGFVPSRPTIRYLVQMRDMELWLAPIAGTRLMVPHRAVVPTPFGMGVLQATQFVTTPQATQSAAPAIPASARH